MKILKKDNASERLFFIFALILGLTYAIITPPFQVPDEINHFYRAYQISEGNFTAEKKDNRVGGYIPVSIETLTFPYKKLSLNKYSRISVAEIKASSIIPLKPSEKVFIDFPNTALYSFVSYIPQSVAIFILRTLDCKPFYMLYITRIISLLFWITLVFFAIKILPFKKNLFIVLALLPMSLSVNSSLSADIVTNAISFLLITYVLRNAFSKAKFSKKDLIVISLLVVFLGLAKILYVLLAFIFIIIPREKFSSLKHYTISFILVLILGFGFVIVGKKSIDKLYTPYSEYNEDYRETSIFGLNANMDRQIHHILNNKSKTVKVFVKSFSSEFKNMLRSYIGKLGWGDTQLPDYIILLSFIIIFLIAISSNYEGDNLSLKQIITFLVVSLLLIVIIMLSQYLTWNPVGSNKVYPLQGRYFIPVFPLFFLILTNKKLKIKIRNSILFIFILFLNIYSLIYLYNRFYYNYNLSKEFEIRCNAESQSEDGKFILTNNDTIEFKNPGILSSEKSFFGEYSIKLNSKKQFGYSQIFKNVNKGDKFIVSARRFGKNGNIVFQEDTDNGEYLKTTKIINRDKYNKWYNIESVFFAPKDFNKTGLKIYLWYSAKDSAYFDDYKIEFFKKQIERF